MSEKEVGIGEADELGREGLHEQAQRERADTQPIANVAGSLCDGVAVTRQVLTLSVTQGKGGYIVNDWAGPGGVPIICQTFDDVIEELADRFGEQVPNVSGSGQL